MAKGSRSTRLATVVARVEGYRTQGDSAMAKLGRQLHLGREISGADAEALGKTSGLVTVLVKDFRTAGYIIVGTEGPSEKHPGFRVTRWRWNGERKDISAELAADAVRAVEDDALRKSRRMMRSEARSEATADKLPVPRAELANLPREPKRARRGQLPPVQVMNPPEVVAPILGAFLQVRALALTDDGSLVLHLKNGSGVWQVEVTGHVEP